MWYQMGDSDSLISVPSEFTAVESQVKKELKTKYWTHPSKLV